MDEICVKADFMILDVSLPQNFGLFIIAMISRTSSVASYRVPLKTLNNLLPVQILATYSTDT